MAAATPSSHQKEGIECRHISARNGLKQQLLTDGAGDESDSTSIEQ